MAEIKASKNKITNPVGVVADCDYDVRNVLSWRVPNNPSTFRSPSNQIQETNNSFRTDSQRLSKGTKTKQKKDSAIAVGVPDADTPLTEHSNHLKTEDEGGVLKISIGNKLWKVLFSNVNRGVDELYDMCEEEEDEQRCKDAIDIMERSSRDFRKLIERIEEQKRFDASKGPLSGGISWEVRKPTNTPPKPATVIIQVDQSVAGEKSLQASISHQVATNLGSSLRATAQPFQPTLIKIDPLAVQQTPMVDNSQPKKNTNIKRESVEVQTDDSSVGIIAAKTSSQDSLHVNKRANLPRSGSSVCSNKSNSSTGKAAKQLSRSGSSRGPAHTQMDKWDEHTHMEVTNASEKVWAEAEAWVDAEAAAEENEWRMMEKTVNKLSAKSWDSAIPASTATSIASSNADSARLTRSLDALDKSLLSTEIGRLSRSPDRGHSATVFASAPTATRDDKHVVDGVIGSAIADVSTTAASLVIDTVDLNGPQASKRSSPVLLKFSPNALTTTKKKPFPIGVSPNDGVLATPSPSSQFTYPGSSGGRTLHDKLSSPDRKRDLSPTEALKIHEARQIAAETNRDKSMAEKVQKAMIASTRVKLRGEKEAQRLLLKEQALEEKLKDAELRHTKYIKQIKGKAGNENAKVNEVIFINSLNSEGIAEQLQQKLEEVEARILAASERRQQRLAGIGNRERKKNTMKANQMCELRLALERQKMERWEKLQKRLHAVQQRKAARLEEIQRRCDEAATVHGSDVSSLYDLQAEVAAAFEADLVVPAEDSPPTEHELTTVAAVTQSDNKSGGVLMLLKSTSKAKMKKGKNRKAKGKNGNIIPSDELLTLSLERSAEALIKGGESKPVLVAFPADCLEDGYKSMQSSLSKKQLKTARESCSLVSEGKKNIHCLERDPPQPIVVEHSQMSMANWVSVWRSKNSLSGQVSKIETVFKSVSEIFPIATTQDSASVSMRCIFSEKATGCHHRIISDLHSILESIVSTENNAEITEFIDNGGIFILRILLGAEVGLISTIETFVQCLSLSLSSDGVGTSESNLYSAFWVTLFHAFERCCCIPSGVISAISSGIFPLLSDILLAVMAAKEAYRKGKASSKSGTSLFFDDNTAVDPHKTAERKPTTTREDAAYLYNDFDKHIYGNRSSASNKNVMDWLAPSILFSLSQLLIFSGNQLSCAETAEPNYLVYMDAFVWYLISANHLGNLVHSLRMIESDTALGREGVAFWSHFIFCASLFISSCCSYLSTTTPMALVSTMMQLSNRTLRHSRGKLIVSLVRKSDVAASLLHIMDMCASAASDSASATKADNASYAAVFFSFANAFAHLSALDLSIVQQFSDEQQVLWNRTFHFAVTFTLGLIKTATIEAKRKISDEGGLAASSLVGFFLRHRFLQRAGRQAARRYSSEDVAVCDAENGLAAIVKAAGLACLRCPAIQKVCGMQSFMGALRPASSPHQATLQSLCKLSTKYFKDKRFKHILLPALISMCLDVDSNIFLLRMENKMSYIVKYLELHLRQVEELNRPTPPQSATSSSLLPSSSAPALSHPPVGSVSPNASSLMQFSQVLPVDLWNISLITLSS